MLGHAPRGHCGSSVGSLRERLVRNGDPRQEWVTDLKLFAWGVLHGLRVRVVVFLFCFFLRLCGSGDEAFGNGMVRSYGRLLGGGFVLSLASVPSGWGPCQWMCVHVLGGALGSSSASGQRPLRLGPAPVCVFALWC